MKFRHDARSQIRLYFSILALILSSCATSTPDLTSQIQASSADHTFNSSGIFQVYFTDPASPRAKDYEGGPDEALAASIDRARLSVDIAAYSLNLWSIRNALISAHKRGVVVRMVMESDNMDNQEVQQIMDAGIPVVDDQHEGLMHNKYVVIDRSEVWTGSMNFTVGGAYRDNNNLISIRSSQIAEDYTSEFEEMFTQHLFGPDTISDTPFPEVNLDGTRVEVYFSPDDNVAEHIVTLIQEAHSIIVFMTYNFTSNDIGNVLIQQAQAGINVMGIMDHAQVNSSQGTEYDTFMQAGLNVRLDGNPDGLMHHKVIIIDQQIVITGSYNFTASAEDNNDENVVIIYSPEIAGKFIDEFQRVHDWSQQPTIEPTLENP